MPWNGEQYVGETTEETDRERATWVSSIKAAEVATVWYVKSGTAKLAWSWH